MIKTEKVIAKIQERKMIVVTFSIEIGGYLLPGMESSFKKANMMMCMDQMAMLVMLLVWHTDLLKFHSPVRKFVW